MTPTLLLADDSVTIQRVIELTFANEDVKVVTTVDGEAAIQRIDANPPDIVLADVGMPKLDGYAVSAHVKNSPRLRTIPVLLLSGAFDPVDDARAKASGCDGVLVKPFEPQQLVGRVRELLSGRFSSAAWSTSEPAVDAPMPRPVREWRPTPEPSAPAPVAMPAPDVTAVSSPPPVAVQPPPPPISAGVDTTDTPTRPDGMPEVERSFQREFDELDAAFAELDAQPAAGIDEETVSDFARDLHLFRKAGDPDAPDRPFGDWDLPNPPAKMEEVRLDAEPEPVEPIDAWPLDEVTEDVPPVTLSPSHAVEPPVRVDLPSAPSGAPPAAPPVLAVPPAPAAAPMPAGPQVPATPAVSASETRSAAIMPKISMAGAFSALLAAEQSQPEAARASRPQVAMSEATVEEIVRRVLGRMTDEAVRRIVLETAERLIREEIEKIKEGP